MRRRDIIEARGGKDVNHREGQREGKVKRRHITDEREQNQHVHHSEGQREGKVKGYRSESAQKQDVKHSQGQRRMEMKRRDITEVRGEKTSSTAKDKERGK